MGTLPRRSQLKELALFAGVGGGGEILGGIILGWRTVCAVEIDPYCQKILLARQRDGMLPQFPIWDDIRTFDGKPWRGTVDVVSGGFPCQDISAAGTREGLTGKRSGLWFEMLRVIEEVRPRFVFAENSPHLRTRGLGIVVKGLADLGYDCRWCVLGAGHIGANHRRNRLWIYAYAHNERKRNVPIDAETEGSSKPDGLVVESTNTTEQRGGKGSLSSGIQAKIADVEGEGCRGRVERCSSDADSTPLRKQSGRCSGENGQNEAISRVTSWWDIPRFAGMDDGVANRMDRVRATGNGQVPGVAALAWKVLRGET